MSVLLGSRLGSYEVTAFLGEGGMGAVYRARDSKLNRDVALKVLLPAVASDPERLARFRREAQVLASLNHPHIGAIHGLEESGDTIALVLEFVDGPTLADRIAREPIAIDEALPIARQIAEALEAAHEQGIVHRDLKPANIKVRDDGMVKVLDFGLAKALDQPSGISDERAANAANSPTITSPAMTQAGVILGTAAYMSPEQARGKAVDRRTDIWAFGCVLFEMLTGVRAFHGETVSDTISAILRGEPDWSQLPSDTPSGVRRLLESALTKDQARRLRHIGDVSLLLEPQNDSNTRAAAVAPRAWQRPAPIVVGAALVASLSALAGWSLRPAPAVSDAPATHLTLDPPRDAPISNRGGLDLAISPNGRLIAFLADGPSGRQLYLRDLAKADAVPLPGTESADDPFFSWNGRSIIFESRSESKIMRINVDGGSPVAVPGAFAQTRGMSWGPDDTIVSAYDNGLWRIPAAGGSPQQIFDAKAIVGITSRVLPGGKGIIFDRVTPSRELMVLDSRTGEARVLLPGQNAWFVPSGHLLFSREGSIMAVGFDPDTLTTKGDPEILIEGTRVSSVAATDFVASDTGTIAYIAAGSAGTDRGFQWLDRSGHATSAGTRVTGSMPRLSPDGRRLAVIRAGAVWSIDLERGTENRVGTDAVVGGIAWTPDSRRITFVRRVDNGYAIELVSPDGEGAATSLFQMAILPSLGSWSPDGTMLGLRVGITEGRRTIAFLNSKTKTLTPSAETTSDQGAPRFSPDGSLIAFVSEDSGRPQVYVRPFPNGPRFTVSVDGGVAPVWSRDGKTLYFAGPVTGGLSQLMASGVEKTGDRLRASVPTLVLAGTYELANSANSALYDVSADGSRFIVLNPVAETAISNRINVILNWPALLRSRKR